jgi:CRP/FNR family transcriptional regulator, anaerobic regulatory protein
VNDVIGNFPGLEAIEPEARGVFAASAQVASVPAGTVVFRSGSPCENYMLLIDGSVRVQMVSENGREIVLYRVDQGQTCILTTSCLMTNDNYSAEGITETDVNAVMVPASAFHQLMACSAVFRSFVFASYGTRLSDLLMLVDEVAFHRIDVRLARFLIERTGETNSLQTTHQELAVELGSAREVISRQLKEFERRGWLKLSRGQIDITDTTGLQSLASNSNTV